jgi:hypothetical protein
MRTSAFLAFAGLAAFITYCFNRGQGAQAVKREVKEDLRRWESEGGNVPTVATPSPTTSTYPTGDDTQVRH